MILQNFGKDLVAKAIKVTEVYGQCTFGVVSIKGVDAFVRQRLLGL